jgi:hypothetical protein
MTEQAAMKGDSRKVRDPSQLNMRVFEDDRQRLEQLQTVTGLMNQSEILRYALKYTADRHPVSPPPDGNITPALVHDIAGLTALLKAFFTAATSRMDKESQDYRFFVTGLLLHIGDPMEVCALLAENLPEQAIVLRYSHTTHLQYEFATECLVQNGISLDERMLEEEEQKMDLGRKAFRLYLDDLFEIYADQVNRYRRPGEYANFVSRLRRYARSMLHAFVVGAKESVVSRELEDGHGDT